LSQRPEVIEQAFAIAKEKCQEHVQPQHDALLLARRAREENSVQLDRIVETITSGAITRTLLSVLDEKAHSLKLERERLKAEELT
jgi:hypothetical protein